MYKIWVGNQELYTSLMKKFKSMGRIERLDPVSEELEM
jgi:hypothetical protein